MILHLQMFGRKGLLRSLSVCLAVGLILPSFSALPQAYALTPKSAMVTERSIDFNAQHRLTKRKMASLLPVKSGLQSYDETPLAERVPVVLIHGIGGTDSRLFNWEHFLAFTQRNPAFNQRYKIYLYHYDSTRSVPAISQNLHDHLKRFIGGLGGRQIKILAYSEGGLLTRNALQDPYLDAHILEVLTIATPFHGSPLANPEWLDQQVKTESPFSLVRIGQKLAYKITRLKYPTFRQDFHWDNFDGAIPADQYTRLNGVSPQMDYALAKKTHFVTYGSYFGIEVDPTVLPRELGLPIVLPKERVIPQNLFRKNVLLSLIRNNMGRLPLANRIVNKENIQPHQGRVAGLEPVVLSYGKGESSDRRAAVALPSVLPEPGKPLSVKPPQLALSGSPVGKVALPDSSTLPDLSAEEPLKGSIQKVEHSLVVEPQEASPRLAEMPKQPVTPSPESASEISSTAQQSQAWNEASVTSLSMMASAHADTLAVAGENAPPLPVEEVQVSPSQQRLPMTLAKPAPPPVMSVQQLKFTQSPAGSPLLAKNGLSAEAVSLMMFNDGISPITSTLWLGRYTGQKNGSVLTMANLWDVLRALKGNPNTRLFAGLDHRNWMDGKTRTGDDTLRDLLNPDEPPRTVFEWILYDLMS